VFKGLVSVTSGISPILPVKSDKASGITLPVSVKSPISAGISSVTLAQVLPFHFKD
jgi:hypothetical protein